MYYSGQGKLYVASRDGSGNALQFRFLGNVPELSAKLTTENVDHVEATSGNRLLDQKIQKSKKMDVDFTLEDFSAANMAVLLYGTSLSQTGASVTNEALPAALVSGDFVRTKYPSISAVSVKNSLSAAMTLGTNYSIENAATGLIKIATVDANQPWTINYTYATHTHVPMFGTTYVERWLRFEGLNTANSNSAVLVELYRVILDPIKDMPLIQDNIAQFKLSGGALYDAAKAGDAYLGQFGRVVIL